MLAKRLIVAASFFFVMALSFVMVFVFYRTPALHPWPEDYASILAFTIDDPGSSFGEDISEAPSYIDEIDYAPVNVTEVSLGLEGNYLYIRLDFAGEVPPLPVLIEAEGDIERQIVAGQHTVVAFNTDGDTETGSEDGAEVLLTAEFIYGEDAEVYGAYDFNSSGELSLTGELGGGGMQYDYAVVRYDISGLSEHFTGGTVVMVEVQSVAESDLYNQFAYEEIASVEWTIP